MPSAKAGGGQAFIPRIVHYGNRTLFSVYSRFRPRAVQRVRAMLSERRVGVERYGKRRRKPHSSVERTLKDGMALHAPPKLLPGFGDCPASVPKAERSLSRAISGLHCPRNVRRQRLCVQPLSLRFPRPSDGNEERWAYFLAMRSSRPTRQQCLPGWVFGPSASVFHD